MHETQQTRHPLPSAQTYPKNMCDHCTQLDGLHGQWGLTKERWGRGKATFKGHCSAFWGQPSLTEAPFSEPQHCVFGLVHRWLLAGAILRADGRCFFFVHQCQWWFHYFWILLIWYFQCSLNPTISSHIYTYLLIFVDGWCSSNSPPLDLSAFDDCQAGHWGVSGLPSLEA